MSLIDPGSRVPDAMLRELYIGHFAGIRELLPTLAAPPYPVSDVARLDLARSFADDALALLPTPNRIGTDRADLVRHVNLSYEVLLILIDYVKTYTDGPRVPRPASAAPPPGRSGSPT